MIVVDTNLIGYLFLESSHSALAEQAWRKDNEWVAPLLWRSEFRNVLAHYIRKRWLTVEECRQIMASALELMEAQEYEADSDQVLRLVAESNCSAYECEFVAVAQELRIPLVTVDKQILREFPAVAVSLADFAEREE
ncbi:MAG: PIN domain-containing protein [Chloroflexi bacterium]|jgi:predicted nucleic acid-binding protein|uniref:type II toxin-antitoxin system VapC family toxin n=1 Tax=Candidatus Roseilinea sp. NK_OTU-006 TaxID=2704250 RepID=UPI000F1D354F|nr:type II toxin-antitoxin system VapC family toxin [Candidatus Roseilinea sp. NK_OTU-006]RMG63492.1 MAG: PIN domain-containing protein [Chloroflexota bacterium]